jgi:glycosyltransferase involved in cell wall biosynthesis
VAGVAAALVRQGVVDALAVAIAPWQRSMLELVPGPITWLVCEPPRDPSLRVAWHAMAFPRLVRRWAPDVVHVANVHWAPMGDLPCVLTVHDLAHFEFPEKFGAARGYTKRALIRRAVATPQRIVAVSEYTRREIERWLRVPASRVRVIHEGGPPPSDPARIEGAPPYFLFVGQLERSKNAEGLIEAFTASRTLGDRGVELWIAGRAGNAGERVRALAERKGGGRVRLLGYVEESALPSLYASAIGFVYPSLVEGFGLALLEAMAFGTAVVASRAGALPEVVGDAGVVVDAADRVALQTALERVATEPALRASLVQRGRQRLACFSWDAAARETAAVYAEAVAEASR